MGDWSIKMVLKRPGSRDLRTEEDSIERMKNDG